MVVGGKGGVGQWTGGDIWGWGVGFGVSRGIGGVVGSIGGVVLICVYLRGREGWEVHRQD